MIAIANSDFQDTVKSENVIKVRTKDQIEKSKSGNWSNTGFMGRLNYLINVDFSLRTLLSCDTGHSYM